MQRVLYAALTGSVLVSLMSCGGTEGPVTAEPLKPTQVQAAAGTNKLSSAKKKARGAAAAAARRAGKVYIVQLSEPAVAGYGGGIRGFSATRPEQGSKLDAKAPGVAGYRAFLHSRHEAVLASVGTARKIYSYAYTFNGFAAELSEAQAKDLARTPGVLSVVEDEMRKVATATTPQFLGLSGRDGFWRETGAKGEDIIIGVVDSGVWPEHESFSDRRRKVRDEAPAHEGELNGDRHGSGDLAYRPVRGWRGTCMAGEEFTAANCNNKLIGARYFSAGFGTDAEIKARYPTEYLSARDSSGHGTHTASTAGGNADVTVTGQFAAYGKVSGIAPRARIAVYKSCWGAKDEGADCLTSDSMAAIDQAVEDGVDVINFSVGGSTLSVLDPVEQAFMRAADAGVFVAVAAGNEGPGPGTMEHPSPWLTTVAAGTHNRAPVLVGTLTLGNGTTLKGATLTNAALGPTPMINAANAALAGADPQRAPLCPAAVDNNGVAVLDPAKVRGKIVVCDLGTRDFVNKSRAVAEAGGVGMVLVNTSTTNDDVFSDNQAVPTVHLHAADGVAAKAYAAAAGGTGAISKGSMDLSVPAPATAVFSSRGPTPAVGGNLLKPDVIAPGVFVLAGVSPPANSGREFDLFNGTSMASPHIAGIAALLKELHPRWSPMAIKSALMTSAGDVIDGPNTSATVIFSQGAGHVQPNGAADPGLVFDSGLEDWLGFLCGTEVEASQCTDKGIPVLDPSDMNTASIAIGSLAGVQTVTRRVTNVDRGFATYTAAVSGMGGLDVAVKPRTMTLAPGQTRSFKVTFTRTSAAFDTYTGGQLMLTGGTQQRGSRQHKVRVPMVVRPIAVIAPDEVSSSYALKFAYDGPFQASARGLVAATTRDATVAADGTTEFSVTIPAGTTYARFSLLDSNASPGSDLDMLVLDPSGKFVGDSTGPTSQEEVNLIKPAAGTYTVQVFGLTVPDSGAAKFTLFSWMLDSKPAGNVVLSAPAAAVRGTTATVGLSFTGLKPGTKYLGAVDYSNGKELLGKGTLIRADP
ncbi:MAG TPA: S8 family serine peptidase [Burkholderiaceae bacterium]|nr:S8 family serine peptidase [Burkholderiaceae bacterium]